ncbi:WecB/TagA/CpsF family glycosyltransferase [Vibrio metschnikovii]|uniref:WecB/TagA/CpsF family glycosyltransferase n=1 Tax=Vibrio metschnikovii TaxID=28172 RepID=UPI001C30EDB0|nr:WecB/TagA/CpsF family glycosyltransferase [Vibrio metschnikovii]
MNLSNFSIDLLEFNGSPRLFTFVNPYSYELLEESGLVSEFDGIFVDGISLVVAYNFRHNFAKAKSEKISRFSFDFTSLAPVVLSHCDMNKLNVALIGGTKEDCDRAKAVITSKYPTLNLTFSHSGYINSDAETQSVYENLNKAKVDVIICGMGTPLQEQFLVNCATNVPSLKFGFTCGGFLSQIADKEDYFDPRMNKLNLRWLQRFIRHSYVRQRVLKDYPLFFAKFILGKYDN